MTLGVERLPGYGNKPGEMITLPDGTIVGRRAPDAVSSTEEPALDVRVPGKDGYIKVHVNPTEGGVPEILAPKPVPTVEAPKPPPVEAPKPPPVEAPKLPPAEPLPKPGGMPPVLGGPGTPIGPTLVPPPHSIHHMPIIGEDDPDAPWEFEP